MARSRRAKSQSVSSASGAPEVIAAAATLNEMMPPPSPSMVPAVIATPKTTGRHRKTPSLSAGAAAAATTNNNTPRDRDAPLTLPKRAIDHSAAVGTPSVPPQPAGVTQFLVVAALSSIIEAALQSVASQFGTGDLAAVSKHSESWVDVAGLLGWKFTTLGIYWFGGFDAYDVASLTLLLKTPTLLLLGFFYLLHPSTLALTTVSTIISTTLPFLLFRALSPSHDPRSHPHAPRALLRNRSILTDPYTTISTTVLAAAIFTVILEISFQTFLPVHLVTTFGGIRSLEFIHLGPSGLPVLLLALLPTGFACTEYLFTPSTGATDLIAGSYNFDSATAGLGAHIYHNTWGWYTVRQKTLIGRSLVLGILVVMETIVECAAGLQDVELVGAVNYAAIWGVAVAVTGTVLDWVGGPSD